MKAWILLAVTMAAGSAAADEPKKVRLEGEKVEEASATIWVKTYSNRGWLIHRTSNFRVCALDPNADYRALARQCEALRTRLQTTWFGNVSNSFWSPRCDIIVHASLSDYQRTLGSGVGRSVGCATFKVDGERVVSRRIDIRIDADNWQHDALPHELTHVVLADRFAGRRIPRWADEGMGVLAESTAKQAKRYRVLKRATDRRAIFAAAGLLALTTFPRTDYRDAFYGQSAALVRSLVERRTPAQFIEFIDRALETGYDRALRESYDIKDIDHLTFLLHPSNSAHHSPIWTLSQPDPRVRLAERDNH